MSGATLVPTVPRRAEGQTAFGRIRHWLWMVWRVISSPFRLFLLVRRSMTAASVSLLVIGIVTLNIIWGYPWVGMFSACFSLLILGWIINRIMSPKLRFNFTLPQSAHAGQPISIVLHGENRGKLPAMDLRVDFSEPSPHRKKKRRDVAGSRGAFRVQSAPHALAMIEPGQRVNLSSTITFDRRGIQTVPDVSVTSFFPFHLFRSLRRQPSQTQIAITPLPLSGDEDASARGLLDALGGWSHKLLSGDALDYTGSREYQVGMPVRRWDFNSWARLGRPIVREFQSPSVQLVNLIVDTAVTTTQKKPTDNVDPQLERVLSLAATAVLSLTKRLVRVRMCITSEACPDETFNAQVLAPSDCESMLIRLAAAESVTSEAANQRIAEALEQIGRSPTMVLTTRHQRSLPVDLPAGVSVLRVDPPHQPGVTSDHR